MELSSAMESFLYFLFISLFSILINTIIQLFGHNHSQVLNSSYLPNKKTYRFTQDVLKEKMYHLNRIIESINGL